VYATESNYDLYGRLLEIRWWYSKVNGAKKQRTLGKALVEPWVVMQLTIDPNKCPDICAGTEQLPNIDDPVDAYKRIEAGHIIQAAGWDSGEVNSNPANFFPQTSISNHQCWFRAEAFTSTIGVKCGQTIAKQRTLRIQQTFLYSPVGPDNAQFYMPTGGTYTIMPSLDCRARLTKLGFAFYNTAAADDPVFYWTNDGNTKCTGAEPSVIQIKGDPIAAAHKGPPKNRKRSRESDDDDDGSGSDESGDGDDDDDSSGSDD